MLSRNEITFEKGRILHKEMLDELYDYPRAVMASYFAGASDGILYGLELTASEDSGALVIRPGAIKLNGRLYISPADIEMAKAVKRELRDGDLCSVCFIERADDAPAAPVRRHELEIAALNKEEREKWQGAFLFARVKCENGSLKEIYDELADGDIPGKFAARDGYDYAFPARLAKRELLPLIEDKDRRHPLDHILHRDICAGEGVALSFIKMYMEEAGEKFDGSARPARLWRSFRSSVRDLRPRETAAAEPVRAEPKRIEGSYQGGTF